jgi:hypothetical protein
VSHCSEHPSLDRRRILKGTAVAGLAGLLHPLPRVLAAATARPDLIREENTKFGTADWRLQNVWIDPKTRYRSPRIEGYCSRTSLRAGRRCG